MAQDSASSENAVFIGNLKKDATKEDLKNSIHDLFNRCLLISIHYNDIKIEGKNKKRKHASVHLKSKEDVDKAVNDLGTKHSRTQLRFNFLNLVKPSQILEVNYSVDNHSERRNNHSERRNQHTYYEDGQMLGNETRNKEFKEAGGDHYINKNLKDHVSRYLCGFLNSSQQGTLFIGVKDNGTVVGVKCDQKREDNIRIKIDQGIKTIRPAIFPQNYHVEFVPVCNKTGEDKVNYKVIKITVDKVDNPTHLYEAAGGVYIRRDGSLEGPLKPLEIQEWLKQIHQKHLKTVQERHEEELQRQAEIERNKVLRDVEMEKRKLLEEKDKEINQLQEEKNEEINHLQQQIIVITDEKKHKTKVCVVM